MFRPNNNEHPIYFGGLCCKAELMAQYYHKKDINAEIMVRSLTTPDRCVREATEDKYS